MARKTKAPVQQYRGTTAQHANYTGAVGEITVDTTKKTAVVHDGVTKGGFPLAKESVKIQAGESITVTGGTLAGNNTIAAKIGSKAQRGVLQVGDNIDVSNGVISTLNWTDEVETLTASNSEEISDAMHDNGLLYVSGENTTVVGRAIGELAWSLLPIRSAGYHLLDGSLIYSTGIYAAFYNYMVQLKNSGSADAAFCTETEWQNSVTNYGVCGKFVLNTTNGTVRLPKVTGHVEGTIDAAALGDLIEAGLPNITGTLSYKPAGNGFSGAFVVTSTGGSSNDDTGTSGYHAKFDASVSNSIYGNSETVQTQSIKGFIYIIVGTYAKTDLQVNIDNIAGDYTHQGARITVLEDRVYLVEKWQSDDGTSWYRKWSDGWIEQGGQHGAVSNSNPVSVTFPTPFTNPPLFLSRAVKGVSSNGVSSSHADATSGYYTRTATNFSFRQNTSTHVSESIWYACGY